MEKIKISNYRYERKFLIQYLSNYEVEHIVKSNPFFFSEIYSSRYINNIYFDNNNYANFYNNIEGQSNRIKIRIRWYGDLFGYVINPILELKIKDGLVGKKESIPIKPFFLTKNSKIYNLLNNNRLLINHNINFKSLQPTLLNRYSRNYFQSFDKQFRITIDCNQTFYKIKSKNNNFLNSQIDCKSTILELKYDRQFDKFAPSITNFFPFRITRSSKYITGIEKIFQLHN